MRWKSAIAAVFAIAAFTACPPGTDAAEWWGHQLPNAPTHFIFGYGSLINTSSRNATAGKPTEAIPVRISAAFGYVRSWNERSPSGYTSLGLRKPHLDENASTINGVLYPADGDDMTKFDARERHYTRLSIPKDAIQSVGWQRIPEQGQIWVYVPVPQGNPPLHDLPEPDADFPLLESYIDVVVEGALEYGPEFARELLETTTGWSRFWLNDRELAHRPWVHNRNAAAIDRLLASVAPASRYFPDRAFAERYAARWLLEKQR